MNLEKIKNQCQKKRIENFDIYASEHLSDTISFQSNVLNSVNTKQTSGLGIRIIQDGKVGMASTNSLDEKRKFGVDENQLLEKVINLAPYGDKANFKFPENPNFKKIQNPTDSSNFSESVIDMSKKIINEFLDVNSELKVSCDFSRSYASSHLVNSGNTDIKKNQEIFSYTLSFAKTEEGNILEVWDAIEQKTPIKFENLSGIINNLKFLHEHSIYYSSIKTGKFPIIFTPKALYSLIDILLSSFYGSLVYKKASYLTDKLHQKIADKRISLIEDPLYSDGVVFAPYDHEGVKTNKKVLIENGVVQQFITTLSSAEKLKYAQSSGNGFRSYSSLPSESFTNVILQPGDFSLEQLLKEVGNGLIVDQLIGAGQSNVLSGEFSVNIDLGFLIENGQIKGRVKNAMVADNLYQMLNRLIGLGKDLKSFGNLFLPYAAFSDLNVSAG